MSRILVGTGEGLFGLDWAAGSAPTLDESLGRRIVTRLAVDGDELWAVLEGRVLGWRDASGAWKDLAVSPSFELTCIVASSHGVFVGTEEAHLLHLRGGALAPVDGFEEMKGREDWYTPWGGPPAVRSIAADGAGRLHANVHVGGIPRSDDGGQEWEATIDVDADVHQVLAHPSEANIVFAAAAVGLAVSEDGGGTWRTERSGLGSTYSRAVAVSNDSILLSASDGPRGTRSAVHRAPFRPGSAAQLSFEKCERGLPEWFDGNVDSGWMAARDAQVAFGAPDGGVYVSEDSGKTWRVGAEGVRDIKAVVLV